MYIGFFYIIAASIRRRVRAVSLAAIGVASASTVVAQSTSDTINIAEVHVGARRTEQLRHGIAPQQTLNSISLARIGSMQLSDAVKEFAGVQVKDYGGLGGLKTVSVRSLGARHTAVTYDGVPLADEQSGQADIGRLSLANVREVSLSSGQQPDIFMPARAFAAGATLAVRTAMPMPSDSAHRSIGAGFSAGSFGYLSPSASYSQTCGRRFAFSASGEYQRLSGSYPFRMRNGEHTETLRRTNSDVESIRGEANAAARWGEQLLLAKVYAYDSERGLPGATVLYNPYSAQRLHSSVLFAQLVHSARYGEHVQQKNVLKVNRSYMRYVDPAYQNAAHGLDNRYTQRELYAATSTLVRPLEALQLSAALDGAVNTLDANVSNFATPTRYSLWCNVAARYAHRYVEAMANVLGAAFAERVQRGARPPARSHLSPALALALKPLGTDNVLLRASYQSTYRMPSFNDLYYAQVGNTDLRPERSTMCNFGFTLYALRSAAYVSLSADGYGGRVRDKIVAVPTRNLFVWSMRNVGRVKISGIDITLRAGITLARRWHVSVSGAYTYQKSIDKTDAQSSTFNHQVPYTPRHSGSATASVETPVVCIDYSVVASGERYVLSQNIPQNLLGSYADHSIALRKSFAVRALRCKASIGLSNMLGEQYEVVRNFPMPGRTLRAAIQLTIDN